MRKVRGSFLFLDQTKERRKNSMEGGKGKERENEKKKRKEERKENGGNKREEKKTSRVWEREKLGFSRTLVPLNLKAINGRVV